MTLFLGIDGGGTGCRAAVADTQGHVLGQGMAGPANIATDVEGAAANILAATTAALAQAGTGTFTDLHAVLGLAGANVSASAARLQALLPFATTRIATDAMISAKGALQDHDGIVAAMGTGSVFAVQRQGVVRQYGGRGFVLGDEGSGAVLGRALLAEALRAADGFTEMTPLLRDVLDEMGGMEAVISFSFRARPAEFAGLAPRIVAGADAAAERIFGAAAQQVADILTHLHGNSPLPVVFLGGLGPHYAARLADRWQIRPPLGTGLDGALWLARQGGK
ncbi:ATPase [Gemmobacter fulvus]|uniref:ATPase n=1 Tax=Gemmobacter fulvus TaxID=2840474 RepID=A0A975P559_9RHOB|nr:BadF/BadG/BcrA/BcrD ATPase family protein [Gemmobacter fulvus]MBT9246852.1 ATPase [Gemmobacter fulvus]MDQ1846661.1 BadF/BadG/BcrA/BcrD ATPase family protein [Gemmobacter fulvus]QWK89056.1 ATPase [Gemmobacter fulvus]